jgi:hypothetical protein
MVNGCGQLDRSDSSVLDQMIAGAPERSDFFRAVRVSFLVVARLASVTATS